MWEVHSSRVRLSAAVAVFLGATVLVPSARSEEPKVSISGYDPVAYFTDGKPVQGKTEFEYSWHKLSWRFASDEHRQSFAKDPDHYAPQYDGYCAMGVSDGEAAHKDTVDPEAWAIVDGKLYLTHVPQTMDAWRQKPAEFIKQADENGKIVGKGDIGAQIEQVGKNVEACLKTAGASLSDIIETRTFVADPDQLAKYADLRKQYFGSASPARTIVQKGGLSDPNNLVEVMAFAAVQ